MADWRASMQQTFEYYTVDPGTWRDVKLLDNVKSCTITRDSSVETLGSATIDVTGTIGESYVRIYLITIQNGVKERHPLGTFLVQTPASSFDGKIRAVTMDAYTPLMELKENPPPVGYSILKDDTVLDNAYRLVRENARAPVVSTSSSSKVLSDFVANTDDTWLTFISDLLATADYSFELDELGRILFSPYQDTESMQPIWTYDDSNSSILYPEIDIDHDLFGIPNVVEIISSNGFINDDPDKKDGDPDTLYYLRIENNDENSPVSIVNRGRPLTYREVDPVIIGDTNTILTKSVVKNYAEKLLKSMSSVEYKVSYKHSYCPVRLGDCVRLNYNRAGLTNIKAKVISQSIKCEPGCPVSETAVFSAKLWR